MLLIRTRAEQTEFFTISRPLETAILYEKGLQKCRKTINHLFGFKTLRYSSPMLSMPRPLTFFGYSKRKHGETHRTKQQLIQHFSQSIQEKPIKQFSTTERVGWNKAFQLKRLSEQTIIPNNNATTNF